HSRRPSSSRGFPSSAELQFCIFSHPIEEKRASTINPSRPKMPGSGFTAQKTCLLIRHSLGLDSSAEDRIDSEDLFTLLLGRKWAALPTATSSHHRIAEINHLFPQDIPGNKKAEENLRLNFSFSPFGRR